MYTFNILLSACTSPLGCISAPPGVDKFPSGPAPFITIILRTLIIVAGVYALFNIVLAGYAFLSASGDPKSIAAAWARIWQSILGVAITAGAFVIVALIGLLFFGDAFIFLTPNIYTP